MEGRLLPALYALASTKPTRRRDPYDCMTMRNPSIVRHTQWNPVGLILIAILVLPFALTGKTRGLVLAGVVWVVVALLLVRWWQTRNDRPPRCTACRCQPAYATPAPPVKRRFRYDSTIRSGFDAACLLGGGAELVCG